MSRAVQVGSMTDPMTANCTSWSRGAFGIRTQVEHYRMAVGGRHGRNDRGRSMPNQRC
jgi:hypothetical protein